MSECLGEELVFQSHELGAWFWAQCVKSHEKSLKHLKCFGNLGWILKIKCICQPKQQAACFGQISKIGKDWYSLYDDSYCIWLTADIDDHILHFQVLMNSGLCSPLWDKKNKVFKTISFLDEKQILHHYLLNAGSVSSQFKPVHQTDPNLLWNNTYKVIRDELLSTLSHILKEASQSDISLLHCSGTWVLVNRTIINKLFFVGKFTPTM